MANPPQPNNQEIASILERIAELLEIEDANPFRVQAYRLAAATLSETEQPAAEIALQGGRSALEELPAVGSGLAGAIQEIAETGSSSQLRRLENEVDPTALLSRVPGIGETLAQRLRDELGVESLAELERAAHDGRLEQVEGFGPAKLEAVKVSLSGMLSPARQRAARRAARATEAPAEPPVSTVLEVDQEYREKASAGALRRIAPKRFNPENEAWLPILNTDRDGWSFTALFSNTQRAHELERTDDWVVIYFRRDGEEEQCTVVTETSGDLDGERVVRGREAACRAYYSSRGS